eukprot:CAMPEP_0197482732 /NCGR_PEP_ID=MMETSP1309-20131121/56509_1 /TAXON_ID=464262 /ORGANISM="Genus nov. species nov., Strain RCC998" /LENGTH=262 /DNA_ID=CAMNT_0043025285 /DNA_START=566 /DNA_END=1354 /DNA_ORIENTATION=+
MRSKSILFVCALACALALATAYPHPHSSGDPSNDDATLASGVSVKGEGSIFVPFDRETLKVEIEASSQDLSAGSEVLNACEENVFPEARKFGIVNEDVSEPGSSSNYVDVLKASQAILIDTELEQEQSEPNFSQFRTRIESETDDDFIQQLHSEIQGETFEGVSTVAFDYNDGGMKKYVSASAQQAVQKELMAQAFADAKQQAEMIANLSGMTLGSVQTIHDINDNNGMWTEFYKKGDITQRNSQDLGENFRMHIEVTFNLV